jgi:hypothetical protein
VTNRRSRAPVQLFVLARWLVWSALLRRLGYLIGALSGATCLFVQAENLHILWDTVSPDGRYAIAWSTTNPGAEPEPDAENNPVSNSMIEIATSGVMASLPDLHYWDLKDVHLDHYWLETVWSEDSRYMLVLFNQHYTHHSTTEKVLLADAISRQAVDVSDRIGKAISVNVTGHYDGSYFEYPWFLGNDRFSLVGDAADRTFALYFQFNQRGKSLRLIRAVPSERKESSDRSLNRAYHKLHGLVALAEQKELADEERAWLVKRDAIKSQTEKNDFIQARCEELQRRAYKIISEKKED